MILLVHLLFGAAIGSIIKNVPLAIILAYFSHYFLDLFPHIEYDIGTVSKNQLRWTILKVSLDFCLGILFIYIISKNQPIIYVCAFLAIIPDGFTVLSYLLPNKILAIHDNFHRKKLHFSKQRKISNFWRITNQAIVIVVSMILLII